MKRLLHLLPVVIGLTALSGLIYYIQILCFHDSRTTGFYLLQDLAFLPVQVMLVTLVLNEVFTRRERVERLRKLNMVIGVFFADVGLDLLTLAVRFDENAAGLSPHLRYTTGWDKSDFARAQREVDAYAAAINWSRGDQGALKNLLLERRENLLRMLENPTLLEHESFSELLLAVTHLSDELFHRQNVDTVAHADASHLAGDLQRAYRLLLMEWLTYLCHLRQEYPYIYSLLIRTNPFDPAAKVELV